MKLKVQFKCTRFGPVTEDEIDESLSVIESQDLVKNIKIPHRRYIKSAAEIIYENLLKRLAVPFAAKQVLNDIVQAVQWCLLEHDPGDFAWDLNQVWDVESGRILPATTADNRSHLRSTHGRAAQSQ
eukprot:237303_1